MAMRIFTQAEFEAELKKHGLNPTEFQTDSLTLWQNDKDAAFYLPSKIGGVPDYVLDRILLKLNKLYYMPDGSQQKSYTVEAEKKKPEESAEIIPLKKPEEK